MKTFMISTNGDQFDIIDIESGKKKSSHSTREKAMNELSKLNNFSQEENFNNWEVTNTTRNQVVFKGTQEECEDFADSKNEGNNSKVPVYVAHPSESTRGFSQIDGKSKAFKVGDTFWTTWDGAQLVRVAEIDKNDAWVYIVDSDTGKNRTFVNDYGKGPYKIPLTTLADLYSPTPYKGKDKYVTKEFSQIDGNSSAFKAGAALAESETGLDRDALDAKAKDAGYEGDDSTNFKFGYNSKDKKADNFSDIDSIKVGDIVSEINWQGQFKKGDKLTVKSVKDGKAVVVSSDGKLELEDDISNLIKTENFSQDDIFTVYDIKTKLRKVDSQGKPVEFKKLSEAEKWAEDNGGEVASLLFYIDRIQPKTANFSKPTSTEVHNMEGENQVIEDLVAEDLAAGIKDGSEDFSAACTLYSKKYGVNFSKKYKKAFSERYKKDNFSEDTDEKFNLITEVLGKVVSSIEALRTDLDKIQKSEPTESTDPTTTEESTENENMSEENYVVVNTKTGGKAFSGTQKECDDWILAKSDKSEKVPTYVTQPESSYKKENFTDPDPKPTEPTTTEDNSKAWYDGNSTAKTDGSTENTDARAEELAGTFGYEKGSKEFSEFIEGFKSGIESTPKTEDDSEDPETANFSQNDIQTRYNTLKGMFSSNDF